MLIRAMSDMHGHLPDVEPCDLLILAGDIEPARSHSILFQAEWYASEFKRWLYRQLAHGVKRVVGVAGNHSAMLYLRPDARPALPWHYVCDNLLELDGVLKVYGTPWTPPFGSWFFMANDLERRNRLDRVPPCDILISHGPPYGYGDFSPYGQEHAGCKILLDAINRVKPRLCVFGHIHSGRGQWQFGETILANVSVVDESYELVHPPMEFVL